MLRSATVMRRNAIALALAVLLAGCAGERVKLLTSTAIGANLCCVGLVSGVLLPDEQYGTVLKVEKRGVIGVLPIVPIGATPPNVEHELSPVEDGETVPVTWQEGYTGQLLLGGEVVIVNSKGEVVARTGLRYVLFRSQAEGVGPGYAMYSAADPSE